MPSPAIELALDTIKMKKQALVFVNTKKGAEKTAEEIAKKEKNTNPAYTELSQKALKALSRPTRQCERLSFCLKKGIAFHHAGLTQAQKTLIEDNFRKGVIKIIACTPTLAAGVDLPAFRTIIRDLKRYGRRGMQFIPVLEYLQMAGRAGRPSFDKEGQAIIFASTDAEEEILEEKYIYGEPEEIYSKLAVEPVLRTYVLSLVAGNFVRSREQIIEFFRGTFWAHQYKDMTRLEGIIDQMLALLVDFGFLVSSADEFASADELDSVKYRATMIGKRVAELYLDPLTAHNFINSMKRVSNTITVPFSYLHMVSATPEIRPQLRVTMREYDHIMEQYAEYEGHLIVFEPSAFDAGYDDYLNSVKTALFFNDWIDEKDEEFLLETYNIRPGEIKVKLDLADWLLFSAAELAKLLEFRSIVTELNKLRMRVRYGVGEELLPLLKLKQIGRVRARALYRNGLRDIKAVRAAGAVKIGQIIRSRKIAENVMEQLGEKKAAVKKGKRKGQLSMEKY